MEYLSMHTSTTLASGAELRAARAGDLPAIERLLTKSQLPLAGVAESLAGFVVAESDGTIVGTAALEVCCDNALLRSVAVAPEWRSRGLGRALVARAIADAEARGLDAVYLLTTSAERYFPSFGFRPTTRAAVPRELQTTAEFNGACPDSAVVMCRDCGVTEAPARASIAPS